MGREYLGHGPIFRTLYILLFDSDVGTDHLEMQLLLSALLVYCWGACVHVYVVMVRNRAFLSTVPTVTLFFFIYPWKKFWIEKPVSPAIKKQAEECPDKLLSLEKGLRGFSGKGMAEGRGSEPRKTSFLSL